MNTEYPVRGVIDKPDVHFYNVDQAPFRLHGVWKEDGIYRRMPDDAARRVSEHVYGNSRCSAGGRVRFVTDSPYVIIRTIIKATRDCHQAQTGGHGYDLYTTCSGQTHYGGTFMFPHDFVDRYESIVELPHPQKQIITINMPLFAEVSQLLIGLKEGCVLERAPDYTRTKPIVYYGSSITHGGCSNRSGTSYTSMVSRRYDSDYISLGFNGSARGQAAMAEYIAGLDMSIFVLDYDHNSPLDELRENHERFFRIIRDAQPQLPVLMMSRPKFYLNEEEAARRDIIKSTYEKAKAAGDNNVWFLSGPELMYFAGDEGTADNCHPTDLGFHSMTLAICKVFDEIFAREN